MKRSLPTMALALALALPAPALASVTINFGTTTAVPSNNDFQSQLNGLGLTRYASSGASLILSGPADITFEFLGSESGFSDTFTTGSLSFTENTSFVNNFGSPVLLGTRSFAAGSLAGLLRFTSSRGVNATVGDDGFGIFLGPTATSGQSFSTFYLGYDDQINNQDDNHDDMIIRARVTPAVPEPGTWAMMLIGFGVTGFAMRRQKRPALLTQAV